MIDWILDCLLYESWKKTVIKIEISVPRRKIRVCHVRSNIGLILWHSAILCKKGADCHGKCHHVYPKPLPKPSLQNTPHPLEGTLHFIKKKKCGPFFKSLLNLLQYCFCFMFCFFLAWRYVRSYLPNQESNHTPYIGRQTFLPLDHQRSPGTLHFKEADQTLENTCHWEVRAPESNTRVQDPEVGGSASGVLTPAWNLTKLWSSLRQLWVCAQPGQAEEEKAWEMRAQKQKFLLPLRNRQGQGRDTLKLWTRHGCYLSERHGLVQ